MLKLKDIYVGDIDAKNELLMMTQDEIKKFQLSFTMPSAFDAEDYLDGRNFFVTGLKGTGKTALLRYLAILAKERGILSQFVLFKSQIKEGDRENLKKTCDTLVVDEGGSPKYLDDYEKVWLLFMHKMIVNLIHEHEAPVFESNVDWKKYHSLVLGADYGNKALGILEYFPRIRKGAITFKLFDTSVADLKIDFEDSDKTKVKLTSLINAISYYFEKLIPKGQRIILFVDELELNLGSQTQYKRDAQLIRDLIIAIEQMNRAMAIKKFPVKICCALRREVIRAIEGTGKEIAKPVEDFGFEIIWSFPVGNTSQALNHSLITLLANKLYISEYLHDIQTTRDTQTLLYRYFPKEIYSFPIAEYMLYRTWFRPRDFSRMLKMIIKHFGESSTGFLQMHFEHTQKSYATASWTELVEELSAKYSKLEIRCIEGIFTNCDKKFNITSLRRRIKSKSELNREIGLFATDEKLSPLLNDLFMIGLIGNIDPVRFHFRGDTNIDLEREMQVHRALWPQFSII